MRMELIDLQFTHNNPFVVTILKIQSISWRFQMNDGWVNRSGCRDFRDFFTRRSFVYKGAKQTNNIHKIQLFAALEAFAIVLITRIFTVLIVTLFVYRKFFRFHFSFGFWQLLFQIINSNTLATIQPPFERNKKANGTIASDQRPTLSC